MGDQVQIQHMTQLYYVRIHIVQGTTRQRTKRQPISIAALHRIIAHIDTQDIIYVDKLMLNSTVTLAFFGMLRSAEYTCPTSHSFVPTETLLLSDITISTNAELAIVSIKASKTDQFKQGTNIRIAVTHTSLCPVTSLLKFMHCHPNPHGPLFSFHDETFLTRRCLANSIQQTLPDIVNVNTHSFHIGGVTAASSAGISDSQIQILGRWSSDAYRHYFRLLDETVAQVMRRIARVSSFTQVWD